MKREAEAIVLELDYLRLALDDLLALNDLTLEASTALSQLPLAVLALTFTTASESSRDSLDRISDGTSGAMDVLKKMSDAIGRLVDLSAGRQLAMRAQLDELQEEHRGD